MTEIVKVGYIRIVNCSSIFIAQDNGYFQDEGIEVDLIPLIGGEKIMTALQKVKLMSDFLMLLQLFLGLMMAQNLSRSWVVQLKMRPAQCMEFLSMPIVASKLLPI